MNEERFSVWLSMAARDRPIRNRLLPELGRAGFWRKTGGRSNFSGVLFGRGAGVGRVLAASGPRFAHGRRVATDTRVIRLKRGGSISAVRSHLRYIVRAHESAKQRLELYGPESASPDVAAFARSSRDDRHQFRTVVSARDACEYDDLRPLVRRLMTQVALDLRTRLEWVAADHYDTAHPHSHVVVRGVDDKGGDLIIAREYIQHGLQQRAAALVALDLGPDLKLDNARQRARRAEIGLEKPTGIDRDLLASLDGQGRVSFDHVDNWTQAERAGRLRVLGTLGLAHADGNGLWYLQPDLIERLDEIEWRNRTARAPSRSISEFGPGDEITSLESDAGIEGYTARSTDARTPALDVDTADRYFAALDQDVSLGAGRAFTGFEQHASGQRGRILGVSASADPLQQSLANVPHIDWERLSVHLPGRVSIGLE
ncbi:hypothetical protein [Sphingomonas oryzagri]